VTLIMKRFEYIMKRFEYKIFIKSDMIIT